LERQEGHTGQLGCCVQFQTPIRRQTEMSSVKATKTVREAEHTISGEAEMRDQPTQLSWVCSVLKRES